MLGLIRRTEVRHQKKGRGAGCTEFHADRKPNQTTVHLCYRGTVKTESAPSGRQPSELLLTRAKPTGWKEEEEEEED